MAISNYGYNDFIGFTFNGQHSSKFKVLRTNDGSDRYQDDLIPGISDSSEEVPGGNGVYYFGSKFNSRDFDINIAYDEITESDKRAIKLWLYPDHDLHPLIFDERPYITYWVKLSKNPQFSELCFDNKKTGERTYKGEAQLSFTAYMPFGVATEKELDNSIYDKYNNIDQWASASRLLSSTELAGMNKFISKTAGAECQIYNAGDTEVDWILEFTHNPAGITLSNWSTTTGTGYVAVEKITDDKNYVIFIEGKQYIIAKNGNIYYFSRDGVQYNCSVQENYFITEQGEYYQAYTPQSITAYTYNYTAGQPTANTLIYLYNGNYIYECYVISVDSTQETITINFTKIVNNVPQTLYGGNTVADSYIFQIYSDSSAITNKRFVLTFPAMLYKNLNKLGEIDKASLYTCKIKINSAKQTVNCSYSPDGINYTTWTGVSGLITDGEIFKLPLTQDKTQVQKFSILSASGGKSYIKNPVIDYTYLYR